jgi:hypothetical protein
LFSYLELEPVSALAAGPIRPDPKLTPGEVLITDVETVCAANYSRSLHHTSETLINEVYASYRIERSSGHYAIDHLIPRNIGGADTAANMWPQPKDTARWNTKTKSRLNLKLHDLVCDGKLDITEAQHALIVDWTQAYQRFCPGEIDCTTATERWMDFFDLASSSFLIAFAALLLLIGANCSEADIPDAEKRHQRRIISFSLGGYFLATVLQYAPGSILTGQSEEFITEGLIRVCPSARPIYAVPCDYPAWISLIDLAVYTVAWFIVLMISVQLSKKTLQRGLWKKVSKEKPKR